MFRDVAFKNLSQSFLEIIIQAVKTVLRTNCRFSLVYLRIKGLIVEKFRLKSLAIILI